MSNANVPAPHVTTDVDPPRWAYRPREAAALLGIARRTLDRAIGRGEIRVTRIGARVLISRDELDRILGAGR